MKEIQNVTIVGAGTMGHSLAQVFAQSGYKVRLNDVQEEILSKAKGLIAANLQTLVELGFLEQKDAAATLSRILTTPRIEEAGRDADFVIEAIIEDQNAKKEIFKTLDRVCPDPAILASNTSYLDIFKFVETRRPDKVLITHWFAPPHIVPLVEIVHGSQTSSETIQAIKALLIKVGKMPIVISKFLPGFIANRLQSALSREVLFLLDNGYATPEDLFKPLLANFALFATALFLWTLMVHDEVDLILPSEAVLCPTMNATSLGKLIKLIKTRLGEKPFSIPSEQSVISEQALKYLEPQGPR
jgi:3-hydroxybutyryl-CoA dehydrogenase